jgi:predicted component of type VI protein secretion system
MMLLLDSTDDSAQFNEIMPTIYARFMEKEAREWRQIYKVSHIPSTRLTPGLDLTRIPRQERI